MGFVWGAVLKKWSMFHWCCVGVLIFKGCLVGGTLNDSVKMPQCSVCSCCEFLGTVERARTHRDSFDLVSEQKVNTGRSR